MKRALVISGGGSKGAYAVGFIKQLKARYPSLGFDIFVGTSTGSLIVPLAALDEVGLLEEIYTSQGEGTIVRKLRIGDRLGTDSIFDANPLMNLIERHFPDSRYEELQTTGKAVFINTTCLQTGELVVFTNRENSSLGHHYSTRLLQDAGHFRLALMASACQPVFMPAMKVNRELHDSPEREFQYVDGGVRQYAGIEMAIDAGATEIFTVMLSPEGGGVEEKQYTNLFGILERTIEVFTDDVGKNDLIIPQQYNDALKYIEAVKRKMVNDGISREDVNRYFTIRGRESPYEDKLPLRLYTIRPKEPLGGGPGGLHFDSKVMKGMLRKGEAAADEFLDSLRESEITWA